MKEQAELATELAAATNHVERSIIVDKQIRRSLDEILQRLKYESEREHKSRERSLAITKIEEGIMWLGMDLKAINADNPGAVTNPYPNSKDPSNTIVDPTADGLKL